MRARGALLVAAVLVAVVFQHAMAQLTLGGAYQYEFNAYPNGEYQLLRRLPLGYGPVLHRHLAPLVVHSPSGARLVSQTTGASVVTPFNGTHETFTTTHSVVVSTADAHLDGPATYTVCARQHLTCAVPVACAPPRSFTPTAPGGGIVPFVLARDGVNTAVGITATFWVHNTTAAVNRTLAWSIFPPGVSGVFDPSPLGSFYTLPPAVVTQPGTGTLTIHMASPPGSLVGTIPLLFVADYNGAPFSHRIHGADVLVVTLPPHRARHGVDMPRITPSTPVPRATLRFGAGVAVPATWCVANGTCAWEDRDAMWCAWDYTTVTVEVVPTFYDENLYYMGSDPRTFTITNVVGGASPMRSSPLHFNGWFPQVAQCVGKGAAAASAPTTATLYATSSCGTVAMPFALPTVPAVHYPANLSLACGTAPREAGAALWPDEVANITTTRVVGIVDPMVTRVQFAFPPGHALATSWLSALTMRQVGGSATLVLNCTTVPPATGGVATCALPPDCNRRRAGAYVGYVPWVTAAGDRPALCPGADGLAELSVAMAVHYGARTPTGEVAARMVSGVPTPLGNVTQAEVNASLAEVEEAAEEDRKRNVREEMYGTALAIAAIIVVAGAATVAVQLFRDQ